MMPDALAKPKRLQYDISHLRQNEEKLEHYVYSSESTARLHLISSKQEIYINFLTAHISQSSH